MKTVIFVRHGKSSWEHPSLSDHDRPLKKRGKKDAALIASKLLEQGIEPQAIFSSSAKRALMTANIFGDILQIEDRSFYPELYHAGESSILAFIGQLNNKYDRVMLFGHNPSYTDLINSFSREWFPNVPTAGTFQVDFNIKDWIEISDFNASLKKYWFPKMFKI